MSSHISSARIRSVLERPHVIYLMKTASDQSEPALKPVQDILIAEFGANIKNNNSLKQMMGRIAKKIMVNEGYEHCEYNVPINGRVFTVASRYEKKIYP